MGNKPAFPAAQALFPPRGARFPSSACWFWALLLACFVVPLSAQENPDQRTIGHGPSWRVFYIEGLVVDEGSGSPIRGVRLHLFSFQSGGILSTVDSDRDGRFVFLNLRGGGYQILANHSGYEDKTFPIELFAAETHVRIPLSRRLLRGQEPMAAGPVGVWALNIPAKAEKEFDWAVQRLKKKEAKKAIEHLQAAVAIYPEYAGAHSLLGTAHLMMRGTEEAKESFQRALEIDGNLADACLGLGALHSAEERFEQSEKLLIRARQLRPDSWVVEYELGQLYWRMGEWVKAEERLRQAAAEPHEVPRLYLLLINVLALQEKYPETLAAMDDFLKRFSQNKFAEQVRGKRELLKAELRKTAAAPPRDSPKQ